MTLDGRTHIAHRVTVDIALSADAATPVERHLREWCVEELLEELDGVATELCPPDLYVLLPRLEIDLRLEALPWTADGHGIRRASIRDAMREGLRDALRAVPRTLTREERLQSIAVEYLRHGMLPDGATRDSLDQGFEMLRQEAAQDRVTALRALRLLQYPPALERWISALGIEALFPLIGSATAVAPSVWRLWLERTVTVLRQFHTRFHAVEFETLLRRVMPAITIPFTDAREVFRIMLEGLRIASPPRQDTASPVRGMPPDIIADALASIDASWKDIPSRVDEHPSAVPAHHPDRIAPAEVPQPEAAFAANAGLVLLAGFLPRFFTAVEARRDNGTLIDAARLPMLLHHLATGGTEAGEWELLLPKILSGLEPADSCDSAITLTDPERAEAESLLRAVIGHWNRLHNVSADGLRAAFLTREGRLRREDDAWRIAVRGEAQDILLQFVPWQYSIIRLPWMGRMLVVDW